MKILNYIPLHLLFFLIIGILIGTYFPIKPDYLIIFLLSLVTLFGVLYFIDNRKKKLSFLFSSLVSIVFITIGITSISIKNDLNRKNHYTAFLKENNAAVVVINEELKSDLFNDNYYATLQSINSEKVSGKIKLSITKDSLTDKLGVDDKILFKTTFNSITKPLNPYQFNYKNYLEKQQVYHQVYIKSNAFLLLDDKATTVKGWAFRFRKFINNKLIEHGFKGDELAIINALLLGQRQDISKDIMESYQNAGAVHILALSGLHIGILLLLLNFLLKPIDRVANGKWIKLTLIVLLLWLFAIIAGLSASIVRAVSMFTAVAIGLVIKNSTTTYRALIISAFFLLLINPYYVFDVGFQLSYFAVFFIVFVQPQLYNFCKPKLKVIDYFWQLITVSTAAQLGVLPLSLFYFHQFPGLFFITNIIIIPFLGFILILGILVILLATINLLPSFIVTFYERVIAILNTVVEYIGNQESFLFKNITFTLFSVIISYLFLLILFKGLKLKNLNWLKAVLFLVIIFQLNLLYEKYKTESEQEFIVFNKSKHSILALRNGKDTFLYSSTDSIETNNSVKSYLIGSNSDLISENKPLNSLYILNGKKLFVVDSLGIYPKSNFKPNYILLTSSPNINLNRLVKNLKPELIIADASNYKSYVKTWQKTCEKNNIKFYYTVTNGAFIEKF